MEIERGCQAFDEDLSAWIDGELVAGRRAEVEAHLASCGACRARVQELRAVDRALLALPVPALRADLGERLARRLAAERSADAPARLGPPRRAGRRFAVALALPAAAAAALALYLVLRPPDAPETTAEPVPIAGELETLDPEELAVALELDTIEDLPVIANLELLELLLADEAG